MSPAADTTLTDPQRIIADLRSQVFDAQQRLDKLAAERDEALAQQAATAEVLGVINSSPGDLAPVFDAMLERATALCEAAHGALFIQDGDRFRAIPSRSTPEAFAAFLTRESIYFDPEHSIMGRTLRQRSAIQVSDMR